MGQCYTVEAKFIFKDDPSAFCNVIKQKIKEKDGISSRFNLIHDDMNDPLKCFENVTHKCSMITTDNVWCTEFDASYSWEFTMFDIFSEAMKTLADGSWLTCWPDEGCWTISVHNGEIKVVTGENEDETGESD